LRIADSRVPKNIAPIASKFAVYSMLNVSKNGRIAEKAVGLRKLKAIMIEQKAHFQPSKQHKR
jgi:hypothetical protein